ncbi:MAG: MFS transporter [Elusimicrobia bacterium]|nr:MFS transporter [Elusimicrobiota bacterium]
MRTILAIWIAVLPGVSAAQTVTRAVNAPAAPVAMPVVGGQAVPIALPPGPQTLSLGQAVLFSPNPLPLRGRGNKNAKKPVSAQPLALAEKGVAIAKEAKLAASAPADAATASTERQFNILLGAPSAEPAKSETEVEAPATAGWKNLLSPALPKNAARAAAEPEAPQPPQSTKKSVRWMQAGTALWKFGIDPVTVAVHLIALQALGGATQVAWLVIFYGTSQMIATSLAAGFTDRHPAAKVAAGAALTQAGLVAAVLGLSALGWVSSSTLFPLYAALGAATGVLETARRVVPALVLGKDEQALKQYNGSLHMFYETAGVSGALLAGAVILKFGAAAALWLQPIAALGAAYAFSRVSHAFEPAATAAPSGSARERIAAAIKGSAEDLRIGAKAILGDPRLRWFTLVMVLPAVVHRVFENVLLPVFAKQVLEMPAASAWLLGSSNLGELIGAAVLLRFAATSKGPFAWLRLAAVGLLGIWALSATSSLPLLFTLIFLSSLTWAASDLSLLSFLQSVLPEKTQPRALGFLVGLTTLVSTVAALSLGKALDGIGAAAGIVGANAAFTILAVALYFAAKRLKK